MEPSRVGPYLIERKIGAGGMGTVYLGHHAESGQAAAVKVLPASLAREEGLVARFNREIDALSKLSNPHVVECYESGVDGETYYYSMEYVDGETIADLLKRDKRMDWKTVIELSLQVCTALKAAHDAGIIHRDLKPSNLLVTKEGQIKLADFGIAQVFAGQKLTMTGGVVGTAEYMSPEQAQGQRATKTSDLYSLGAVMYAMLTGRPPFTGKTAVEVMQKHRFNQFDAPRLIVPDIPIWLDDVVCQLMEKDPDKRYPDAYVLSLRLKEIPRKVELAGMELTRTADSAAYQGDATTVAGMSELPRGPGDGTLMRDLLRAEIERQQQPSHIGRLLDNTWFLAGALVLLVGGGIFWAKFRETSPQDLSPQEKFDAGVELMQGPEGDAWLAARDNYFNPLVAADADKWEDKVGDYLNEIKLYELKRWRSRGKPARSRKPAQNDAERFYRLAVHYHRIGDDGRARGILLPLTQLLAEQDDYQPYCEQAQQLLSELAGEPRAGGDAGQLLDAAIQRAERLAEAGQPGEARAVYESIITLYGSDPSAADRVRTAITNRNELPNPAPRKDNP